MHFFAEREKEEGKIEFCRPSKVGQTDLGGARRVQFTQTQTMPEKKIRTDVLFSKLHLKDRFELDFKVQDEIKFL